MPAVAYALHFCSMRCAWSFTQVSEPCSLSTVLRVNEILIFGVHACADLRGALAPPPCGHHSRCVRPCFQRVSKGFQPDISHVVVAVKNRGLALPSRSLADQASHLHAIMYRTSATLMTTATVAAFHFGLVPLGQRAVVDQFRPSLIDRSAEPTWRLPCLFMADPGVTPAGTRLTTPTCCLPQALSLEGPYEKGRVVILERHTLPTHLEQGSPPSCHCLRFQCLEVSADNCRFVDGAQNHQNGDISQRPWTHVSVRRDSRLVP